eukprot:Blabericola_migrator_1__457@NODE_110_length_13983_cov_82_900618_g98_i0_p5_GENE_NODE_110_length_13983_cov_82_900618_g98_i0NODE_110_length_13983_cov_82_900618_g98_i0_p5_ORF_typecomplete_len402_score47_86DUF1776/PF08643_10/0_22DUF1776/PF08643_10/7_5e03DUF4440/PF14534_6/0_3_NODE_110_length_13983_cov_82_900618_g98_i059687173
MGERKVVKLRVTAKVRAHRQRGGLTASQEGYAIIQSLNLKRVAALLQETRGGPIKLLAHELPYNEGIKTSPHNTARSSPSQPFDISPRAIMSSSAELIKNLETDPSGFTYDFNRDLESATPFRMDIESSLWESETHWHKSARSVLEKRFPRVVRTLRSIGKFRRRASGSALHAAKEEMMGSDNDKNSAYANLAQVYTPPFAQAKRYEDLREGELVWSPHEIHIFVPTRFLGKGEFVFQWPVKGNQKARWSSLARVRQSVIWRHERGRWLHKRVEKVMRFQPLLSIEPPEMLNLMQDCDGLERLPHICVQSVLHKLRLEAATRDFIPNGSVIRLHNRILVALKPNTTAYREFEVEESMNFEKSVWLGVSTLCLSITWELPASIYQVRRIRSMYIHPRVHCVL